MTTEPIKLTLTEEEFMNCAFEMIESDIIKEMLSADPILALTIPIFGSELWKILEKRARIQVVANTLGNMGKENK